MIIKMQEMGFCGGVNHAVNQANKLKCEILNKKIYMYGDIINNSLIMTNFIQDGYIKANSVNEIENNSIVIIRAHGVAKKIIDLLNKKKCKIIDCTCANVDKIHKSVLQKSILGYKIIVVGKQGHPEVEGIVGWCESSAYVISDIASLNLIDLSGKLYVVAQTTFDRKIFLDICNKIKLENNLAEIYDSVCSVTERRKKFAKEVACKSDIVIVIGDKQSSNANELYKTCLQNKNKVFFVSSVEDLKANKFDEVYKYKNNKIGLVASASTDKNIIESVYYYLATHEFKNFLNDCKQDIEFESEKIIKEFLDKPDLNSFVQDALCMFKKQHEDGKRIRGALIRLGEEIASNSFKYYLRIAVCYEMFQTSVLIHDDIMDNSDTRRNKITIHVETANKYLASNKNNSRTKAARYGAARALCIGNYGYAIACYMLSSMQLENNLFQEVINYFFNIVLKTCEGELMDVVLPYEYAKIINNKQEYYNIINLINKYKTAYYTLVGPIMLGAICGNASQKLKDLLKNIMTPLGIAFQIRDDILGIYSSKNKSGKSMFADIREFKQTVLFAYAYHNCNKKERKLLKEHYGKNKANLKDLEVIKKIFISCGAKEFALNEIKRLSKISLDLINSPLISQYGKDMLYGLVNYLINRDY